MSAIQLPEPLVAERHNMMIRLGANQAIKAVEWLITEGFEIIGVNVDAERRCPVISIKTIGKCNWLRKNYDGAPYTIQPGRYGRTTTYRAPVMGCKVEWTEGGH
jgi:hypothetical protein